MIDYKNTTPAHMWQLWKTGRAIVQQVLFYQDMHGGYFTPCGDFIKSRGEQK